MSSRSGSSDDLDTWEVVSRASSNEPDLEDSDSDSSIEVVSVDTDTECELAMSSSPSLGAGSVNPVFVLRVPSTEADGLSGESSESADEGDVTITKALQAVCHRQDVDFSSGEKTAQGHGETPQGHGEIPTTHGREETDIEPGSSVDLSSSNISMTSMSSDTDRTVDTSVSESVDGADSTDLVRSARSIKTCSSKKSLNDEHTLVDTTLTDEGSFSQTDEGRSVMVDGGSTSGVDEGSLSKSEEESSSGTESTTAAEPFPSLPPLPSLPVDPDIVAKVTDLVELRKPLNVAEQDMGDEGHVPDKAEINRGYIVEDKDDDEKNPNKAVSEADDEEIHEAVPDSGDSMEEPQEGFDIEAVHPKIENSVPPSNDGDDLAENSTKSTSIIQETRKFPGNIGTTPIIVICITVLVVISFLNGYMVGKIAIKSTVAKEMADFKYEIARIHQRDLEARDTEIDFLQQSIDWMTDYASYDLDKLQSSNTELVLDPKFTAAGYEHEYFLFTFGKYADNNGRELVRRDKLTTEEVQCKNSIELMNKVNHLEQERADLIQLVGVMRYGSPPSVSNDNSGKQAPDQVQVDEGQEFSWFSTDDQHLNSQGHSEDNRQGHTEDNHRLGETDEAHKEEDKIASLESDLILEKARSDMWQKMYTEQKESSESMTCSGNEIVKQFRQLLQNLSVPEDLSENMKDKWEVVKNQSLDGWQLIMDLASSMTPETTPDENDFQTTQQDDIHKTTSHGNSNPRNNDWGFDKDSGRDEDTDDQNDFSSRSNNKKRSLPKWSETIRDVYNKTKSSMSDVSQQIKETWEQVKNLSQDLWMEHEPSMRKLKEKVSKKVEKVSEKLSTWFTRRRAYANHKRSNYWQSQQKSEEETSSKTGSTKRRSFTAEEEKNNPTTSDNEEEENDDDDDDDDEDDQKEWEYSKSLVKKYRRQFLKFRTKMDKLSLNKFLQMNFNHWKKAYRKIERFVKKIDLQVLSPPNRKWLTCQRDWWFSICTNVIMDPNCRDVLQGWQVNRTGGNPSNSNGSHDNGPHSKCQRKGDRSRKHCGKNNRGEKRRGDKATGQFPNRQYSTSEQHYQDEKNRRETHKEEEYSDSGNEEIIQDKSSHYCDPNSGDCPTRESSWYMQQLKHRLDMRSLVEQEAESGGDSDWMFTRAEERDFQRTLPDDWYFRKLDSNQYKENDFFDEE